MTPVAIVRLMVAALLIALCAVFRVLLESDPVTHVIVQLPVLAFAGWLAAGAFPVSKAVAWRYDAGGLAGVQALIFTVAFWMLPRSIDGALDEPMMEFAKFVSIPLLVGAPAAWSWPRLQPVLRGFLKANAISMMGILAFLYTHAPIRICNSYLVSDQERLGMAFLCVSFGLSIFWTLPLFLGKRPWFFGRFYAPRNAQI